MAEKIPKKTLTLEQMLDSLEDLVAKMEDGGSLDETLELYARAVKLASLADSKLTAARQKVEKLGMKEQDDGEA